MLIAETAPVAPNSEFNGDMDKTVAVLGPYGGSRWLAEGLLAELSERDDVREVTYTPLDVALNDHEALQEAVEGAYVLALSAAMAALRKHRPITGIKQLDAIVPVELQTPQEQLLGFARLNVHELKHAFVGPDRRGYLKLVVGKLGYIAMHPATHLGRANRNAIGETSSQETLRLMRYGLGNDGAIFNLHAFRNGDQMGFNLSHKAAQELISHGIGAHDLKADYPDHEIFFRRPAEVVAQVYGKNPDPAFP